MNDKPLIAQVLGRLVEHSGLSHNELARQTGIPQPTISRLLLGKTPHPNHQTCSRLAAFFGISEAQLRGTEPIGDVSQVDLELARRIAGLPEDKRRSLALLFGLDAPPVHLAPGHPLFPAGGSCVDEASDPQPTINLDQYLAAERAVMQAAAECGMQDDLLLHLLPVIGRHLGCNMGVLWRLGPSDQMHCGGTWQAEAMGAEAFVIDTQQACFQKGEGLPGQAWATGQGAYIQDINADNQYRRAPEAVKAGLRGAIAVPVRIGNETLGVLEFLYATPIPDGQLLRVLANLGHSMGQIKQHRRLEKELQEAEWRFRNTFDYAPDGRALVALAGTWLQVNRALCKLTGYSEQELLSRTFQDMTHPEDLEKDLGYLQQLTAGEIPSYQMEKRYFHRSGRIIHVLLSVTLVRDEQETPLYFAAQIQDITERKRAEQLVEETTQRYKSLFDHNPKPIYAMDLNGRFITGNAAFSALTGYHVEELLNTFYAPLVLPADLDQVNQYFKKATQGEPQNYECRMLNRQGQVVHLSVANIPIIVHGQVAGVHGVAQDITEQKRMEEALRQKLRETWNRS